MDTEAIHHKVQKNRNYLTACIVFNINSLLLFVRRPAGERTEPANT